MGHPLRTKREEEKRGKWNFENKNNKTKNIFEEKIEKDNNQ